MPKIKTLTITDANGDDMTLPHKWEICPSCDGEGTSSAYLGSWTAREWQEEDEDFRDDYMAGAYDRACECCHGSGKIMVADAERMTEDQRALWTAHCEYEYERHAEQQAEQRMMSDYYPSRY